MYDVFSYQKWSPLLVQKYISSLEYNSKETLKSAKKVLEEQTAHCLEATHLAAALLEFEGYPPLALSMESEDNIGHVVYIYRQNHLWGSIGRSREPGLQGRLPVFGSLYTLLQSYINPYIDDTGCITGYAFLNLDDSGSDWRHAEKNVWKSEKYILGLPHKRIHIPQMRKKKALRNFLSGGHPKIYHWL